MVGCLLLSLCWVAPVGPADVTSAPAEAATEDARALAQRLTHDARSLGHLRSDAVVGRGGRILALLATSERLWPRAPRTNRQLVSLYEELGDLAAAARAAERYARARPADFPMGVRLIRLGQAPLEDAERRIAFLQRIAGDGALPAETRAFAWAELAGLYHRQGEKTKAREACAKALGLDRLELAAMQLDAQLAERKLTPVDDFRLARARLESNPRSVSAAWDVAELLQAEGLCSEAIGFYEHARELSKTRRLPEAHMEKLLVKYFNALLDAGQAQQAADKLPAELKQFSRSRGLLGLMVEACRRLGQKDKAQQHVAALQEIYETPTPGESRAGAQDAAEKAWFELMFLNKPGDALPLAKSAAARAGDDAHVRLVLGAAQVKSGDPEEIKQGEKLLKALVETAPHGADAAAILAEYCFQNKRAAEATDLLQKGAQQVRSGPGWRMLKDLAGKHGVKLPEARYAEALRQELARLPGHVLEMGRDPGKFLRARLTAPGELALGEPVAVTVELENVSTQPVPIGQGGLFSPVLWLGATVEGAAEAKLPELTPAPLPAPKYLPAGAKVSTTVRIDVGPVEELLTAYPMGEIKLTVTGMLDPLHEGGRLFSSVPEVQVQPVTIRRKGLFDPGGKKIDCQYALGYIVRDLRQGDLDAKLRGARQTAALLAYARRVELGKAPPVFPDVMGKLVLLSMTRAFLQCSSPAVRAEMLSSLQHVPLGPRSIALLAPVVGDPHPAVRMRLIELLAGQRTSGHERLLDHFARDEDDLVRDMANALRARK